MRRNAHHRRLFVNCIVQLRCNFESAEFFSSPQTTLPSIFILALLIAPGYLMDLKLIIFYSLIFQFYVQSLEWDYDGIHTGPANWSRIASPLCAGKQQSPIQIWPNDMKIALVPRDLSPFDFHNLDNLITDAVIENNGHSDNFIFTGLLSMTWVLSIQSAAHFVHTCEVPINGSSSFASRIAVLAVFFELVSDPSVPQTTPLSSFASYIKQCTFKNDRHILKEDFEIQNFYPADPNSYMFYKGSLTTPPCTEDVSWVLFTHPMPVTIDELNSFRELHANRRREGEKWLQRNFRPTQPLYGRQVLFVQQDLHSYKKSNDATTYDKPKKIPAFDE
ncbi:Carbonic anhydrase 2 [Trichinella patagoniensis]|uniref:carbonic anhydrase n=1 Tax=Trichinella patagoniensis TaxID=990121 RepID=A0A0V0ZQX1_9BILA|nr:Carbonic anhydrase 2 [Trichinella patagoniensis]